MGRRYLVTGATGFVGSYMTRRLVETGREVHVLARATSDRQRLSGLESRIGMHTVDLLDSEGLERALKDIRPTDIWHLATYGGFAREQDSQRIAQTNFIGTSNLLEAASRVGFERFINTGSSSEYGHKDHPMREDDLLDPLSVYGASKAATTLWAQAMARTRQLPVYTLRLFSAYGPGEEASRLVPTVISACLRGIAPSLASPRSVRDFVYVEDIFRLFDLVEPSRLAPGEILNVGSGQEHTVGELVETVMRLAGASVAPVWGSDAPRPNEPRHWVADVSKAERLLGWRPAHSLEAGLRATLEWTRESLAARA